MENSPCAVQVNSVTNPRLRSASPPARSASTGPADSVQLGYIPAEDRAERDRYYGDALKAPDGKTLFANLHELLAGTHSFSMDYSSTLKMAPFLNLYPDGTMHCVYTGVRMAPPGTQMPDYLKRLATDDPKWDERWAQATALAALTPEAAGLGTVLRSQWAPKHDGGLKELEPYSLEHLVPQSWFERARPMRTDLHILSPVENNANSARGNLPLTDLPASTMDVPGGKSDLASFDPKQGKGEAARATLYFLLRHPGLVGDRPGEYRPKDLQRLLDWHRKYPVTDFERHRNAEIQKLQGNRNPLVDFPQLAEKIDFTQGFAQTR